MIMLCSSIACLLGVTCNVNDVTDATKSPNQATISYPNSVTYTCTAGYQLSPGVSSVSRQCGTDGNLSGTTPTCTGKFDFSPFLYPPQT